MKNQLLQNILSERDYLKKVYYDQDSDIEQDEGLAEDKDFLPFILGNARVKGKVICNLGNTGNNTKEITFAVGICQGPITRVNNIYVNGVKKIFKKDEYKIHFGTLDQLPDPVLAKILKKRGLIADPEKNVPSYRGLAYVVFYKFPLELLEENEEMGDELDLDKLGKMIPLFSFDVLCLGSEHAERVSKIKAVNIIPGCGEFVYDTRSLHKKDSHDSQGSPRYLINCSEQSLGVYQANSLVNLDSLKEELPQVNWVAPVVCWFGNDLNIGECKISPRVEYRNGGEVCEIGKTVVNWRVAGYKRNEAQQVGSHERETGGQVGLHANRIRYGGTVSDNSIKNYLKELKSREYNIMFYPMLFLDIAGKPWRGEMHGEYSQVPNFFNKKGGYNEFILHYANLVKDDVDAFVIGSELEGITKISTTGTDGSMEFPAVNELMNLASKVKKIFNDAGKKDVIVTYAANWSEYHHECAWHHLDPLWMCKDIDVIGIDAYFPATDTCDSDIDYQQIKDGYTKGEIYEYWYDKKGVRKSCAPEYALKNIEHWWKHEHFNGPKRKQSCWIPEAKPIWFTEFGFASMDKSTNEPNVFFDSDAGSKLPKLSSGDTDFALQEEAIVALIDHFESIKSSERDQKMVQKMFLWCWDARYPAWPSKLSSKEPLEMVVSEGLEKNKDCFWTDSHSWEGGHYVNGKLSGISIREVLYTIFTKNGFLPKKSLITKTRVDALATQSFDVGDCATTEVEVEVVTMQPSITEFEADSVARQSIGAGDLAIAGAGLERQSSGIQLCATDCDSSKRYFSIDKNLSGLIRGLLVNQSYSGLALLETLRLRYKFDIFCTSEGNFQVVARDANFDSKKNSNIEHLAFEDLRYSIDTSSIKFSRRPSNNEALEIAFIVEDGQNLGLTKVGTDSKQKISLRFPILMSYGKAYSFAHKMLRSIEERNNLIVIQVPFYFPVDGSLLSVKEQNDEVTPINLIELKISQNRTILIRVVSVNFYQREKELVCVMVNPSKAKKFTLSS